jgi:hypothetical protein
MTQNDMVLDYLNRFGSITPIQAFADLGIMRLGARVWDLKREGHDIITETEHSVNRFGLPVSYARYKIHTGVNPTESTPYSPEYNYTNNQGELL